MIRDRLDGITPWPPTVEHARSHGLDMYFAGGTARRRMLERPDAELVAHAPDDLAWLLAEVDRLTVERDALREQVQGHCERIAAQSEILSRRAERVHQ